MAMSRDFQLVMGRILAVRNARYIPARALHVAANACDLDNLGSNPEDFLLKFGSDLTPMLVISFVNKQGDPELAYQLFSLARQHNGYKHDGTTYSAMIHLLCRTKHFDLLETVLQEMKAEKCSVEARTFTVMLKAMGEEGMIQETLRLFHQMYSFGCKPTLFLYRCILSTLVKAGEMEEAMRVYVQMRDAEVYPDSFTIGMLTSGLCKAEKVNEAQKLVESVIEIPGSVDVVTLNGVIGCMCKARGPSAAYKFLESMKAFKVAPNVITYNKLMAGFCNQGKIDEAVELLDKMAENSISPSVVTFNTILNGLCKQSKIDDALLFFEKMFAAVERDTSSYNIMVNGLCKNMRTKEAWDLVCEMIRKGFTPTVHTYTAIVHGFFKLGKVDEACEILRDMKEIGIYADTVLYNNLIDGLCQVDRVDDARGMLTQMAESGCHPNKRTHSLIIYSLCKANRVLEAMEFGYDMLKGGCDIKHSVWAPILGGLCRLGKTDEALKLLDVVSDQGFVPNRGTFNAMLKGLCMARRLDDMRKLLVEMKRNGISADQSTYAVLLDGNAHHVGGTADLFYPLIGSDIVLDLRLYISLIDGLFSTGEVELALKVFKEMQRVGCAPVTSTFNAVIDGLCKNRKLVEAKEFFQSMKGFVCEPDTVTYTALIHGFSNAGQMDVVDTLYEEMQTIQGCQPDVVTYSVLLSGFSRVGRFKEMYGILDDMRAQGCLPNNIAMKLLFRNLCPKDIKRVNKYVKEAFGITYDQETDIIIPARDEWGEDVESSSRTGFFKAQEEGKIDKAHDLGKPVADMGKDMKGLRTRSNKGSFKVSEEQHAHEPKKCIKAERLEDTSKHSFVRVKSEEDASRLRPSVRTRPLKVQKGGKIEQGGELGKSVKGKRQEDTARSGLSARRGFLKVPEEREFRPTRELKKKAVRDLSQVEAERSPPYRMKVAKEGKVHEIKGLESLGEKQKVMQKRKKP